MDVQESDLPFKTGQHVESRSFLEGFRGSWFRSKIQSIHQRRKNDLGYNLKFLDFPDEKITWTKIYQKPQAHNNKRSKVQNQELMVRPRFPPVHQESQMPGVNAISEPIVIINKVLKVGDLIDWWADGCYWSGSITQILKDDKFQIELLPPPHGEGASYEASLKDMRPSLDWSLEHGWTAPAPLDSDLHSCARIIHPAKQGPIPSLSPCALGEQNSDLPGKSGELKSSVAFPKNSEDEERRALLSEAQKSALTPKVNKIVTHINSDVAAKPSSNSGSDSHVRAKSTGRVKENSILKNKVSADVWKETAQSISGVSLSPVTLPNPLKNCKSTEKPLLNVDPNKEIRINGKTSGSGNGFSSRDKVGSMGAGDKNGVLEDTLEAHSLASSSLSPNGDKLGAMGKQSSRYNMENAKVGIKDGTNLEEAVKEAVDQGVPSKLRLGSMDSANKIGDTKDTKVTKVNLKTIEKRPWRLFPPRAKFGKRDKINTAKAVYQGAAMKMRPGSVETGFKTGAAQDQSDSPSLTPSHPAQKVENLGTVGKQPSVYHGASTNLRPGSVETGCKTGVPQDRLDSPSPAPSHSTPKVENLGAVGKQPSGFVIIEAVEPPGIDLGEVKARKRGESETEKEGKSSKKMRIDRNTPTEAAEPSKEMNGVSKMRAYSDQSSKAEPSKEMNDVSKMPINSKLSNTVEPSVAASSHGRAELIRTRNKTGDARDMPESPYLAASSTIYRVDSGGTMRKHPSGLVAEEAGEPSGVNSENTIVEKRGDNETEKEAEPLKNIPDRKIRINLVRSGTGNKTVVVKDTAESPLSSPSLTQRVVMLRKLEKQSSKLVSDNVELKKRGETCSEKAEKESDPSLIQRVVKPRELEKQSSKLVLENLELKKRGEAESVNAEKQSDYHDRACRELPRNTMFSETVESAVIDLEELLCMIKWMKRTLRNESTSQQPWKFVGHRASSTPR